jgi:hypothetical protein
VQVFGKTDIYAPSDYMVLMRSARAKKPYTVHDIDHSFFKNYESLPGNFSSIRPGKKSGDPTVADVRGLLYEPSGDVRYKLQHNHAWTILPCRRRDLHCLPKALYNSRLKIKTDKYSHLQDLKSVIPLQYHRFYDSLPHD